MVLQPLLGFGLPYLYLQLFSSILLPPAVVVHPSEPHLPIYFLVFTVHSLLHNEDLYLYHLLLGPRPRTLIISFTTSVFYRNM